jgi:hypothetical protein
MCPGALPGHLSIRQSRPSRPVKESKIAVPPRTCTATPTTPIWRAPSPAASANRKPDAYRAAATAGRGQPLGAQARPAHVALDATAADMKTAFGRAATTAVIFTDTWKQGFNPRLAKVPSGASSASMRCTDK